MPGNKKNRRVGKNRPSALQRAEQSKYTRAREIVDNENRIRRLINGLPLGHPENAHKIDLVFGAIDGYLLDMEQTGQSHVTASGQPAVLEPVDQELIPAGLAFLNQHRMFSALAVKRGWGPVPDGLRRMGAKLDAGVLLFESDMTDARTALAWMRAHVADVTASEWSAVLDELIEQEERDAREKAA